MPQTEKPLAKLRILLVEDDKHTADLVSVSALLRGMGVDEIVRASTVEQGKQLLKQAAPDLVLCDYELTASNGLDLVDHVRRHSERPELPVIMLTSHTEPAKVMQMRDAGATDVITKPVSPRILQDRIAGALADRRPFVRSERYVGPDRRGRESQLDERDRPDRRAAAEATDG